MILDPNFEPVFNSEARRSKQNGTSISPTDLEILIDIEAQLELIPIFYPDENEILRPRVLSAEEIESITPIPETTREELEHDRAVRECSRSARGVLLQKGVEFYLSSVYALHLQRRVYGNSISFAKALQIAQTRFHQKQIEEEISLQASFHNRMAKHLFNTEADLTQLTGREAIDRFILLQIAQFMRSLKVHVHSLNKDFVLSEEETLDQWQKATNIKEILESSEVVEALLRGQSDPGSIGPLMREALGRTDIIARAYFERFCQLSIRTPTKVHEEISGLAKSDKKGVSNTLRSTPDLTVRPENHISSQTPLICVDWKSGDIRRRVEENRHQSKMDGFITLLSAYFYHFHNRRTKYPNVQYKEVVDFLRALSYSPDIVRIAYVNIDPSYEGDRVVNIFPDLFTENSNSPNELFSNFQMTLEELMMYIHFKRINKHQLDMGAIGNRGYPRLVPDLQYDFTSRSADRTYVIPSM